ncbi:arginine/serine-rich 45 [Actinidia rufa]|uniref:Arginine/serine-rich 45 n=1 Tax=Actinidia rufa TaxID=165716 RepID=A0A7J0DU23_9ERIC|nr:arginine/serine-rich 45 [Actinidia rufa]
MMHYHGAHPLEASTPLTAPPLSLRRTMVGSDTICNDPSGVLTQQLDSLNYVAKMLKPKFYFGSSFSAGNFGEVVNVRLIFQEDMDMLSSRQEFMLKRPGHTWMGQIDGNVVRSKFTLPERKKVSSPPKVVATASKKDAPKAENVGGDVEKDGPKRQRETSPRRKPRLPLRRRSPIARRGGSPIQEPDSPPHRRVDSPVRRRGESPYRCGETPPRRRPAFPGRGHSPSSLPRRNISPARASPHRIRGSPVRRRPPIPPRRRICSYCMALNLQRGPLPDEIETRPEGLRLIVDEAALLFEGL